MRGERGENTKTCVLYRVLNYIPDLDNVIFLWFFFNAECELSSNFVSVHSDVSLVVCKEVFSSWYADKLYLDMPCGLGGVFLTNDVIFLIVESNASRVWDCVAVFSSFLRLMWGIDLKMMFRDGINKQDDDFIRFDFELKLLEMKLEN